MPQYPAYTAEIDSGNTVKIDLLHWNIQPTGITYFDPVIAPDSIYFYLWGPPVNTSGEINPENPTELWNLEEGLSNIGHAVTAVGYITGAVNYVIVHDNWPTTPKQIAIPWGNWVASLAMNPPPLAVSINNPKVAPERFHLSQNYPNPFNPGTVISWQMPATSDVELSIFNILGEKIVTLISEKQKAGHHTVKWDARNHFSGESCT